MATLACTHAYAPCMHACTAAMRHMCRSPPKLAGCLSPAALLHHWYPWHRQCLGAGHAAGDGDQLLRPHPGVAGGAAPHAHHRCVRLQVLASWQLAVCGEPALHVGGMGLMPLASRPYSSPAGGNGWALPGTLFLWPTYLRTPSAGFSRVILTSSVYARKLVLLAAQLVFCLACHCFPAWARKQAASTASHICAPLPSCSGAAWLHGLHSQQGKSMRYAYGNIFPTWRRCRCS